MGISVYLPKHSLSNPRCKTLFYIVFFGLSSALATIRLNIVEQTLAARERKSGAYSTASPKPLQALYAGVLVRPKHAELALLAEASS
jgi:hypothetical protein